MIRRLLLLPLLIAPLAGQGGVHVLLITGLSAETMYAKEFTAAASMIYDAAKATWGISDSSLIYLGEDRARDPQRIRGVATKENVGKAFEFLSHRAAPGDQVFVFLLGHGTGEGGESKVNLPGPDATAKEYGDWLTLLAKQTIVFVNASSGSGDFVPVLSGPGRVIIAATKTAMEQNESHFGTFFARALASMEADADKDGRVSAMEAYQFARTQLLKSYEDANHIATEHAILDDNGDKKGTPEPWKADTGDGYLARRITFGGQPNSSNPRVAALIAERRVLESQLDSLRARKASTDSLAYEKDLERLLLAIATKSQAIRDLQKGNP